MQRLVLSRAHEQWKSYMEFTIMCDAIVEIATQRRAGPPFCFTAKTRSKSVGKLILPALTSCSASAEGRQDFGSDLWKSMMRLEATVGEH